MPWRTFLPTVPLATLVSLQPECIFSQTPFLGQNEELQTLQSQDQFIPKYRDILGEVRLKTAASENQYHVNVAECMYC